MWLQSDSDEMVSTAGILSHSRRSQRHRLAATSGLAAPPESDSVNENFSPARLQRRLVSTRPVRCKLSFS